MSRNYHHRKSITAQRRRTMRKDVKSRISEIQRSVAARAEAAMLPEWLEAKKVAELRVLADGMPYRHEAKKAEIVAWLVEHQREAMLRLRKEQP
jgi:hypothetical protein